MNRLRLTARTMTVIVSALALGVLTLTGPGAGAGSSGTPTKKLSAANSTGSCGVARWPVKTGTDSGATAVSISKPTTATIASLVSIGPPHVLPQAVRVAPVETSFYVVHGTLTMYELSPDSDYTLVLSDGKGNTMRAAIPDPRCAAGSPWLSYITHARSQLDAMFAVTTTFQSTSTPVQVEGIGFWNSAHGQTGAAPNNIELHPVFDIRRDGVTSASESVTPKLGPPGTVVTVSGRNFYGGETVKVAYATGLRAPNPSSIVLCVVSVYGNFSCKAHIPPKATAGPMGSHKITATGAISFAKASTTFALN